MKLLEEIIETLPSRPRIEEVRICAFDIAVKSRDWGLSSSFRDPCSGHKTSWVRRAGELVGMEARELARYSLSDRLLEASLGMAALNSLTDVSGFSFQEINASRIVLDHGRGKNVVVVGDFPFLHKLRSEVKNLWIVSREPWEGREGIKEARDLLARADVAAITGSSFINHTAEELLSYCPQAYTVMLGPSTPFSPVLFKYGVDAISGARVEDPELALKYISQGASFRQIKGVNRATAFRE
ncbi:MAG TPA: hypothetical protein ENH12_02455 [Proteobacteria bacterium]|nr:hypothetical protein [Pseudomonadota bacterium]